MCNTGSDGAAGSLRTTIAGSSAGDTIVIPATIPTITLTSGDIVVNHPLTVTGAGATTTVIDGNHASQIFDVTTTNFTLSGVTLQHGDAVGNYGGAILVENGASLNLANSVIANNSADANGGGVELFTATAVITGSTFTGNTTTSDGDAGGAIRLGDPGAQLTLVNSTLTANTSTCGGGISFVDDTSATLLNDTINTNTGGGGTGGGLDFNSGACDPPDVQRTAGGDHAAGESPPPVRTAQGPPTTTIKNTIVSANTPADCNVTSFGPGTNDLELGTSCGFANNPNSDPLLGALQVNPGPIPVPTEALLAGSPAIDTADNATCQAAPVNNVDERGLPRVQTGDPICDIGAFEVQPAAPVITPKFAGYS